MKILYVAGRWDPTIQNEYSGSDYGAYHMLKNKPNVQISIVGPLDDQPNFVERLIFKIVDIIFHKRFIKYYPSSLRRIGKEVNDAIDKYQPDVIFSKYSAPLVHVNINRPLVYMCDSTVRWVKDLWPTFSKLGFFIMEKWESNVIGKCDYVITFSKASADVIQNDYQKEPEKIIVIPIPAYIPKSLLPSKPTITKEIGNKLHLLLVGKRFNLRGMDIAIEVTRELNRKGIPTELNIVGINGENQENIRFMGNFNKENPQELEAYFNFFRWADLLIHPSRFHSAGIVISEAAGFGLPTITNAAGGLATTVLHDQTGIVLPEGSPPSAYVKAITALLEDKPRYHRYQLAARDRFDQILDWDKAGQQLFDIIKDAVDQK